MSAKKSRKGKKAIAVNKTELEREIQVLESTQVFARQGDLWDALAATQWAISNKYSRSLVMGRAIKFGIPIKTKNARGNHLGGGDALAKWRAENQTAGTRVPRSEKIAESQDGQDWVNAMRQDQSLSRHKHVVDKAADGSLMAVIAAVCLGCACGNHEEIRNCEIKRCGAWFYRPYQNTQEQEVQ